MKLILALFASGLMASSATGQVVEREPTDRFALQAMQNFGRCVVDQTPRGPREVLAMDFRTPEYRAPLKRLAKGHNRCVPNGRLRFGGVLFAGSLAEALLRSDIVADKLPQQLAFDPARDAIAARGDGETMALCTVLKAPAETVTLLETQAASAEEAAAIKAIAPTLGGCLAKGAELKMNKPAMRAMLALAAWRIVTTPRSAQ
jgi:hypothetical protein